MLLQAVLSDNQTKILNSPQVRASDGMKVSLKIGDRIPIATGSFQSGVGTVGGAPYAQTQFQFTDVGIKVEITPQVHSADEVTLHVSFEVSTVRSYTNVGGVQQPIIGQRTNEADIRLREGEVNILAGLDGIQDSSVVNGIPGLVNIPILGKILFGSDHTEKDRQQLMIALIPHIVRTPDYTPENLRGVYSGPDQSLRLMYAPRDEDGSAPPANAPAARSSAESGSGCAAGNGSADAAPHGRRCRERPGVRRHAAVPPSGRRAGGVPARQHFGGAEYALYCEHRIERRGGCIRDLAAAGEMGPGGAAAHRHYARRIAFAQRRGSELDQGHPQRRGRGDAERVAHRGRSGSFGIGAGGGPEFRGRGAREGFGDGDRNGLEELAVASGSGALGSVSVAVQ